MNNRIEYLIDEEYLRFLNEEYPPVKIGGYEYLQGEALKSVDPVAFRQGALDYADSLLKDGLIEEGPHGEFIWS